jgi:hypothetical protein
MVRAMRREVLVTFTLFVADHPYHAVTDASGRFELGQCAAGNSHDRGVARAARRPRAEGDRRPRSDDDGQLRAPRGGAPGALISKPAASISRWLSLTRLANTLNVGA